MPLAALVDHLERTHHAYLREALPRVTALAATVASASPADAAHVELRDSLGQLAAELDRHLAHEEEALFPMVRDLERHGVITPTRCGGSLGGPIACMENEHAMADDALATLRRLTSGRAGADALVDELITEIARLDRDLREHMFKEDEVLFPRALDAQRSRAVAAPAA
jgi:regulator of cell morphogenesis and NO signaling